MLISQFRPWSKSADTGDPMAQFSVGISQKIASGTFMEKVALFQFAFGLEFCPKVALSYSRQVYEISAENVDYKRCFLGYVLKKPKL